MSKQYLKQDTHPAEPANEEIAALAYSFFEAGGRLDGHDLEHWLRAKEQLSKDCSSENKSQKDARIGNGRTQNVTAEKIFAAHAPRSRGGDRYAEKARGVVNPV